MRLASWVLAALFVAAASARADDEALFSEAVVDHVNEIRERHPELREDAFSKMGGSSVASKAFLYCFATDYVDLGGRADLAETIAYFDTGRRNSFNRQSEAAGVSWNLRYVLGGRPANFRRELDATGARWALVLFGSNDAQNQNERVYFKRLVYLVEQMTEMGVVPILGSALPRRSRSKNQWIERFNLITEAVATHWALPYIDYHAALSALPRKGLAKDGVHPNVLPPGGYRASCQLSEEGLRYGNNVRNLLTLEALDALRRATATMAEVGMDMQAALVPDAGLDPLEAPDPQTEVVATEAAVPDPLPISILLDKPSLAPASVLPKNCGLPRPGARHHTTRITLDERTRLRASALDIEGHKARILLVRHEDGGEPRCVRRRNQTLALDARPGTWDFIVEVSERAAEEGEMLFLIARDSR